MVHRMTKYKPEQKFTFFYIYTSSGKMAVSQPPFASLTDGKTKPPNSRNICHERRVVGKEGFHSHRFIPGPLTYSGGCFCLNFYCYRTAGVLYKDQWIYCSE